MFFCLFLWCLSRVYFSEYLNYFQGGGSWGGSGKGGCEWHGCKEAVCLWDLCFKWAACEHDTLNTVGRVLDGYKGMRYAILWDMMTVWLWWLPRDANVGNWPVLSFCYHCNQATKIKMAVPNIMRNCVQLSKISVYWWYKNKDKALLFQPTIWYCSCPICPYIRLDYIQHYCHSTSQNHYCTKVTARLECCYISP